MNEDEVKIGVVGYLNLQQVWSHVFVIIELLVLIILKSHIEKRLASFSLNNLQILLLVFMPLLIINYWII